MMGAQENKMTLILGGNGKTGRRVAERLIREGLPVRIGSRRTRFRLGRPNHLAASTRTGEVRVRNLLSRSRFSRCCRDRPCVHQASGGKGRPTPGAPVWTG